MFKHITKNLIDHTTTEENIQADTLFQAVKQSMFVPEVSDEEVSELVDCFDMIEDNTWMFGNEELQDIFIKM